MQAPILAQPQMNQQPNVERVSEEIVIHDSTVSDAVMDTASMLQEHPMHVMQIEGHGGQMGQMVEIMDSPVRDDDHHQLIELNQATGVKEMPPQTTLAAQNDIQEHASAQMQQVQQVVDQHIPDI